MSRETIKLIVKRHLQAIMAGVPSNGHALLMGPTGSGKTHTIREELSKTADVPIITIDATSLTREGWSGLSLQNVFETAYAQHGDKLESAIVYIDEFDKLTKDSDDKGHYKGVQYNFLPYLDGTDVIIKRESNRSGSFNLSTKNMTFVFSGAFTDFWETTEKPGLGFTPGDNDKAELQQDLHETLVQAGFIKELVYRIPYIVRIEPYDREQLRRIVRNHFGYQQMRMLFGVEIDMEEMLDFIEGHPAGARAIQLYLSKVDVEKFNERVAKQKEFRAKAENALGVKKQQEE